MWGWQNVSPHNTAQDQMLGLDSKLQELEKEYDAIRAGAQVAQASFQRHES